MTTSFTLRKRNSDSIIIKSWVSRIVVGEQTHLDGNLNSLARYADPHQDAVPGVKNREQILGECRIIVEKGGFTLYQVVFPSGYLT
jgi:hypothetical protein